MPSDRTPFEFSTHIQTRLEVLRICRSLLFSESFYLHQPESSCCRWYTNFLPLDLIPLTNLPLEDVRSQPKPTLLPRTRAYVPERSCSRNA